MPEYTDRRNKNEKNLSAQEKTQKDGTRFPQKNGGQKRPQGTCPPPQKRQKTTHTLILPSKSGEQCVQFRHTQIQFRLSSAV